MYALKSFAYQRIRKSNGMNKKLFPAQLSSIGVRLTLGVGLLITSTIVLLFIAIYQSEKEQHLNQIHAQADALLSEMALIRNWVASYNGVWTEAPGDFYLDQEDGYYRKSPAMVTKELSRLSNETSNYRFHITSLMLTNPENVPDQFEHDALIHFEEDFEPVASFYNMDGESFYRLMIPLEVKKSCLECHGDQGYEVGDIRGGLTVMISTKEMDAVLKDSRRFLTLSAVGIVGLVMLSLYLMVRKMVILPVGELKEVTTAIGKGDYTARCQLQTNDELQIFGQTLNQMVGSLQFSQQSLEARVSQRTQELDTISEIALILSRAGDLETVLKEALVKIVEIANADGGFVQIHENEDKTRMISHFGLPHTVVNCFQTIEKESPPAPIEDSVDVREVHAEVCRTLYPVHECLAAESCQANQEDYRRASSITLRSRSRAVGRLVLFSKIPESFSPELMQLLESIGNQLGIAIENASYHQQIEQIAMLEERTRISRELHDSLAQTLGWLSIKTEMLEDDLMQGETEQAKDEIAEIRSVVRDASYDVRESIDGLRTHPTGNFALSATAWVTEFRQRSGLEATFHTEDVEGQLPPIVESELLRILQEALANIRKHAEAQKVQINLSIQKDFVTLQIEDDGKGFRYFPSLRSRHFGLSIMRERAERLGGSFEVKSAPGKGTTILARLPI